MEETLLKDKKYLMGILTGLVLMAIIMVGYNRYQGGQFLGGDGSVQDDETSLDAEQQGDGVNAEIVNTQEGVGIMTPETPHSPQLERLALILREAGRMLERMDEDIVEINESQIATVSQ
ncbi:MAG: hypothetical protein KAJ58_01720 [Candidatus Pacebacteria bacterium]|nr:hypothetical protein [Candidatus Paceibacterota bacterium]